MALDLTSETQLLLENLLANTTIRFQATAYNTDGESVKSAEAMVMLT